jgi:hypothetical protein
MPALASSVTDLKMPGCAKQQRQIPLCGGAPFLLIGNLSCTVILLSLQLRSLAGFRSFLKTGFDQKPNLSLNQTLQFRI